MELLTKINRSNFLIHLARLTRRWRQLLDSEFQSHGLTDATWRPLLHLQILGDGVRQKDLAASVGIEGPSLVRLLDTLVAKGLVKRMVGTADRRTKLLFLTPVGQQLVNRIQETVSSLEDELFGSFSENEILWVADFITRLESAMSNGWPQEKK